MKLYGKYSLGADEFLECEVTANKGFMSAWTRTDVIQLQKYTEQPKDTDSIKINPSSSKTGIFKPKYLNYVIDYVGEDNEKHLIFVKLNTKTLFQLNHNLRKNIYQTRQFKITVFGGLVVLVIWAGLTWIFQKNNIAHKAIKAPYKNQQTSSTDSLLLQNEGSLSIDTTINF